MSDERTKTETNALVGRIYYQALTDAAGYPNGMMYWPEMTPGRKYYETATALSFIDYLAQQGLITVNVPMGFGTGATFDEGECKDLMEHFKSKQKDELKEFEDKLK